MPPDRHQRRGLHRDGHATVNLPGGEILPAAERGVIDCAEWVGGVEDLKLGFHNVWKYHYTPGMHEPVTMGEILINSEVWDKLSPQHKEIIKSADERGDDPLVREVAAAERRRPEGVHREAQGQRPQDAARGQPIDFLKTWDKIAAREAEKDPFFKKVLESQRQYASVVVPAKRFLFPPYDFAANHYWPEKKAAARPRAPRPPPRRPAPGGRPISNRAGYLPATRPGPAMTSRARAAQQGLARDGRTVPALLKTIRVIDAFSDWSGKAVAWLILPLVLSLTYEAIARYLFNAPTLWAFDLSYMLYGAIFMLGAHYTLLKGAHIRTDMLWEKFSAADQGRIDAAAYSSSSSRP